jgi:dienelactone hydrolase
VAGASRELSIPARGATLRGMLEAAPGNAGIVVFVHGSGSSRRSPRNQLVARCMQQAGLGTLLFDLLTADEERIDAVTRHLRFDIELLVQRLLAVTDWLVAKRDSACPIGYFGASTGAAAALVAATRASHPIAAIVSRGGRPDLAGEALARVRSPTLLIVGAEDRDVLALNRQAFDALECEKRLAVVPRATHLFEEPGTLEQAAALARDWFLSHVPVGRSERGSAGIGADRREP